jgi:hypothetical protein
MRIPEIRKIELVDSLKIHSARHILNARPLFDNCEKITTTNITMRARASVVFPWAALMR